MRLRRVNSGRRHRGPQTLELRAFFKKGTSALDCDNVEQIIGFNRAGKDESCLTREQIIDFFCRKNGEGDLPESTIYDDDDE